MSSSSSVCAPNMSSLTQSKFSIYFFDKIVSFGKTDSLIFGVTFCYLLWTFAGDFASQTALSLRCSIAQPSDAFGVGEQMNNCIHDVIYQLLDPNHAQHSSFCWLQDQHASQIVNLCQLAVQVLFYGLIMDFLHRLLTTCNFGGSFSSG